MQGEGVRTQCWEGGAAGEGTGEQRLNLHQTKGFLCFLFTPPANLTARSISLDLGFCPGSAGKSRDRPEPGGLAGMERPQIGGDPLPSPAGKRQLCHDLFFPVFAVFYSHPPWRCDAGEAGGAPRGGRMCKK